MGDRNDFINSYLEYIGYSECPTTYHRWCCISMLGTYLGRQIYMPFGHKRLHPNMYVMLIGVPGTRKSTSIVIAKDIIKLAGFEKISADKTSKEKFLIDLAAGENDTTDDILDRNLWGADDSNTDVREMYVACDEFNDFIGNGNVEFISLLGNMWDWTGAPFKSKTKNAGDLVIPNPTINILGGNTPVNFARAFPPEILGQGFFSRLLLIQSDSTGRRITFPKAPDEKHTQEIVRKLKEVRARCVGEITRTSLAESLLDKIYQSGAYEVSDGRFEHYNNRRFTHLLKLCLIIAASHGSTRVTEEVVIEANTVLHRAEFFMPKALGEFGKSRNSDVAHKIMQTLEAASSPLMLKQIWETVHTDLDKLEHLTEILKSLITADRIFNTGGGFLAKRKGVKQDVSGTINWELLSKDEQEIVK